MTHTVAQTRVKVTKFLTNLALGGTEKQVVQLAGALDPARYELEFACLRHWGEMVEQVERMGIQVSEYPVSALARVGTLRQQWKFAGALNRRGVQVMHSYNFYANVFAVPAARLAGTPCVIASVRDTGVYLDGTKQWLQRIACAFAHRIVVNAGAVRDWLIEQGYDAERIVTIPNGLDVQRYLRPRGGHALRDELGIPRGAPLVLMLARVNRQKGIDHFVQAAAEIVKRFPEAHFVIVGGNFRGDDAQVRPDLLYRREVERLAEHMGISARLHFTGFRDDVPEILAEADVSVLPSFSEGLSNTLLESMAAAVPVVATRVGGTPEAIHDGVHGLLVEPRDSAGLAGAIETVLSQPEHAASMAVRARQRVTERYSFERMARDTEEVYEQVLQSNYVSVPRSP